VCILCYQSMVIMRSECRVGDSCLTARCMFTKINVQNFTFKLITLKSIYNMFYTRTFILILMYARLNFSHLVNTPCAVLAEKIYDISH
jgi:hypothetical protein